MLTIPRYRIKLTQKTIKTCIDSINNGELAIGDDIDKFEKELSKMFGKKYCISTINGFASIFLVILANKIKEKNILVPAISTCFSFINAIKASGNKPIYTDVEIKTGNMDFSSALKMCSKHNCKLIISPNHFGIPSAIDNLKRSKIPIIEDCAQSFLTCAKSKSSAWGNISTYPTEISALSGTGLITTCQSVLITSTLDFTLTGLFFTVLSARQTKQSE